MYQSFTHNKDTSKIIVYQILLSLQGSQSIGREQFLASDAIDFEERPMYTIVFRSITFFVRNYIACNLLGKVMGKESIVNI